MSQNISVLIRKYKSRLNEVRAAATMDMAEEMSIPRAQGGNMPVDTGNLKNSIRGALNTRPASFSGSPASAVARASATDDILIGWTANYAWPMEVRYGFMRLALQKWPQFVGSAAKRVVR